MGHKRRTNFIPTLSTSNNAVSYLFDSTAGFISAPTSTPGVFRGRFAGMGLKGTIKVGDQAVTLTLKSLTGTAGTSSDWEAESGGTITLTANTTYPLRWRPASSDFQATITNGGTGPSSLFARLELAPISETET